MSNQNGLRYFIQGVDDPTRPGSVHYGYQLSGKQHTTIIPNPMPNNLQFLRYRVVGNPMYDLGKKLSPASLLRVALIRG